MFPNAHEGVKKLFLAEILIIVGEIFSMVGMGLGGIAGENAVLLFLILAGILLGSFLLIAAQILQLVGVRQGKKDEIYFQHAFIQILIWMGLTVASAIPGLSDQVSTLLSTLGGIASVLISVYIIQAISNLAGKLDREDMVERGGRIIRLIVVIFILGIGFRLLSSFVFGETYRWLSLAFTALSLVLTVMQHLMYLLYLKDAVEMLEGEKTA